MTGMHAALVAEQQMIGAMLAQAAPVSPGTAKPGTLIRLPGIAQPGPGGVLRSPEAGAPCVWFRTVRIPMRQYYGTGVTSPGPLQLAGRSSASEMGVWLMPAVSGMTPPTDLRSDASFTVQGPDGAIEVLPAGGHIDSLIVSHNEDRLQRTFWRRDDLMVCEWIIPPGAPVYAIGFAVEAPDGHRALVAPQGGKVVVSTRDERALEGMAAHFANASTSGGVFSRKFPVGPGGRMINPAMVAVFVGVLVVALLVVVLFATA